MSVPRKPPFALWVENVEPERVDAKDLWEAFARYGGEPDSPFPLLVVVYLVGMTCVFRTQICANLVSTAPGQ